MPAPIIPLIEAVALWPPRGALIGIDLGTKTIGIAVSDPDRKLGGGYVMNRQGIALMGDLRPRRLIEAAYQGL